MMKGFFIDKDGQVYYYNDAERQFVKQEKTADRPEIRELEDDQLEAER